MSRRDAVSRVVQARLGDVGCVVVALFIGGLATDATEAASGPYAPVNDLVGVAALVALWWRRRFPSAVAAVTFAAAAIAPMAGGAAIVSVYTVAAQHRRRTSLTVAALYVLYLMAGVVSLTLFRDEDLGRIGGVLAAAAMTVAAYGWGLAVRSRRELLVALAERAERAEADQHARVVEARRAERAQIAAEMHDVLAHRLSLLSLHAGAIELRPDASPDDRAMAARVVRATAHLALDDLRSVIGVLRDDTAADLTPPPTMADLEALVAECRGAGMRVEVTRAVADPEMVPSDVGRHAYRVVREGLTNARKHAPGQPVRLDIAERAGRGLRIEIVNPVPRVAPTPVLTKPVIPGAGAGLVGLRERVELAGGTVDHGTDGTDHHRLRVWLPWPT